MKKEREDHGLSDMPKEKFPISLISLCLRTTCIRAREETAILCKEKASLAQANKAQVTMSSSSKIFDRASVECDARQVFIRVFKPSFVPLKPLPVPLKTRKAISPFSLRRFFVSCYGAHYSSLCSLFPLQVSPPSSPLMCHNHLLGLLDLFRGSDDFFDPADDFAALTNGAPPAGLVVVHQSVGTGAKLLLHSDDDTVVNWFSVRTKDFSTYLYFGLYLYGENDVEIVLREELCA